MTITIFENEEHKNIYLEDFGGDTVVQSNVHLIIHGKEAMLLDPGSHKMYKNALAKLPHHIQIKNLKYIFCSHQDPDVVSGINSWLMSTDATALCSQCWIRFIPHFGIDRFLSEKVQGIPDEGQIIEFDNCSFLALPAHFLHSPGNFHLYDPVSKILYSGDVGASLGMDYRETTDFQQHIPYLEVFHKRYMASQEILGAWVKMVRSLDVEMIVPQHGAFIKGKEAVLQFLDWCNNLPCGFDLIKDLYKVPTK